jgi:hypothetical protein
MARELLSFLYSLQPMTQLSRLKTTSWNQLLSVILFGISVVLTCLPKSIFLEEFGRGNPSDMDELEWWLVSKRV